MFAFSLGGAHAQQASPPPIPNAVDVVVQSLSGKATDITTDNCNDAGGLCQPATGPSPANGGAGPNPDNIQASVVLCETAGYVSTNPEAIPLALTCITNPDFPDVVCPILNTVLGVTRLGGGTLTANGTGTGFRFGKTYISLIYKNGNTATCSRFPANVPATLANTVNPLSGADNDFASMMLGFWVVKPDGTATLIVSKQATVTGIQDYGSVSVREVQPPSRFFTAAMDPAPQLNALRACGSLVVTTAAPGDNCPPIPREPPEPPPAPGDPTPSPL